VDRASGRSGECGARTEHVTSTATVARELGTDLPHSGSLDLADTEEDGGSAPPAPTTSALTRSLTGLLVHWWMGSMGEEGPAVGWRTGRLPNGDAARELELAGRGVPSQVGTPAGYVSAAANCSEAAEDRRSCPDGHLGRDRREAWSARGDRTEHADPPAGGSSPTRTAPMATRPRVGVSASPPGAPGLPTAASWCCTEQRSPAQLRRQCPGVVLPCRDERPPHRSSARRVAVVVPELIDRVDLLSPASVVAESGMSPRGYFYVPARRGVCPLQVQGTSRGPALPMTAGGAGDGG
jgi:hypothetical protein